MQFRADQSVQLVPRKLARFTKPLAGLVFTPAMIEGVKALSLRMRNMECLAYDGSSAMRRIAFFLIFSFRFCSRANLIGLTSLWIIPYSRCTPGDDLRRFSGGANPCSLHGHYFLPSLCPHCSRICEACAKVSYSVPPAESAVGSASGLHRTHPPAASRSISVAKPLELRAHSRT
jgi:hypothetical protein